MRHIRILVCLLAAASLLLSQPTTFSDVMVRQYKNQKDHRVVERSADLILDDAAHRLKVKTKEDRLDVAYNEITKIIFEEICVG